MSYPFRTYTPIRTCLKSFNDYHAYKPYLEIDFCKKCGYTGCSQMWFGGRRTFQIDHLKPESKYPHLINEYSNLIYCCSYVNRAKWDDDSPNYLDPCDVDYNNHFDFSSQEVKDLKLEVLEELFKYLDYLEDNQ